MVYAIIYVSQVQILLGSQTVNWLLKSNVGPMSIGLLATPAVLARSGPHRGPANERPLRDVAQAHLLTPWKKGSLIGLLR